MSKLYNENLCPLISLGYGNDKKNGEQRKTDIYKLFIIEVMLFINIKIFFEIIFLINLNFKVKY